jgi:glycosyltransferase involved in cell wall biosynthesis
MHLLHIIPGLTHERGGPTGVLCALVRHQSAAGHKVTVLTTDQGARRGEQLAQTAAGVVVERLAVRGPDRLAYAPGFGKALGRLLRATDLVHVHSIFTYPVHRALRDALRAGVPVVLRPCGQLHHYSLQQSRWLKQCYLLRWGRLVCRACSAWHYTSANEHADSWPWQPRPHFVLSNGIEPADYQVDRQHALQAVRRTWPHLGESPYVLFLGRLHPKKRLDLLLEAFLAGAPKSFKLVVAGPDECRLWPQLASRFLSLPSHTDRVVRLGTVGGSAKIDLLAGATLFVLPSEHENFGNAALEALAAGTPLLLSPHVDLAEAVCTAGLGTCVPLEVEAWRNQLASLLSVATNRQVFAERAGQWVAQHYAWNRIAWELEGHYRWVLAGCPLPALGLPGEPRNEKVCVRSTP